MRKQRNWGAWGGAAATGLLAASAWGQTPSDNCADAPAVTTGTISFDTTAATADGPDSCAVSANSPDVWVRYVSAASGTVMFNTCGTSFDTVLSAFADCGGPELTCNDDTCGLQSSISVPVTAGFPVFIRIAGYDGETGPGTLLVTAPASPWDETTDGGGDAGDLPDTAQSVAGTGPVDVISGVLALDDVDMFEIEICNDAAFTATTVGGPDVDTQLWLFNMDGTGVAFNDDSADTFQSAISSQFVVANGRYLLAVSAYDRDAMDANGAAMWADTPFAAERAPDGPGAAGNVSSWTGEAEDEGPYSIVLTGACRVTDTGRCVADVDDGTFTGTPDGGVTIDDLLYYLTLFEAGDIGADVDNGTFTGTLDGGVTIDDLLYFLFRFEEGC